MKKLLLILNLVLFATLISKAQDTIPNANFENWITFTSGNKLPNQWQLGADDEFFGKDTIYFCYDSTTISMVTGYTGYAVELTTHKVNCTIPNIVNPGSGNITLEDTLQGAVLTSYASAYRPITISGYYIYSPVNNDSATVAVLLTKWNSTTLTTDTVGLAINYIKGTQSTFTSFNYTINYYSSETPDSILIGLSSSSDYYFVPGSSVVFDDLVFSGGLTAVTNAQTISAVLAYPNPAINQVSFSNLPATAATIEIRDLTGRPVIENNLSATTINVQNLPSGIYFYSIYGSDGTSLATSKFVK